MANLPERDWAPVLDGLAQSRYAVVHDALPPALLAALQSELAALYHAGRFYRAGIGRGQQAALNAEIRGDAICWLEPDMPAGQAYLALMDDLRQQLNREFFLGLQEFEAHYAAYVPGSFYRRHVDRHQSSDARVVSSVFYLNRDWPLAAGGELKLYDAEDRLLLTLPPLANTLVLFMSDDMPHEVLAANRERHSIAGWFRIRA